MKKTRKQKDKKNRISRDADFMWLQIQKVAALVIVVACGVFVIVWVLFDVPPNINIDANTPYLLSSISQSLAAILALVFAISLVIIQLGSRYTYRLTASFFDKFTIALIIFFIVGTVMPFWSLAQPHVILIKVSLVLSSMCIFLLLPYFLRLKIVISPFYQLERLKRQALQECSDNPDNPSEPKNAADIESLTVSALSSSDYELFGKGVEIFANIFVQTLKNKWLSPTTSKELTEDEIYSDFKVDYMLSPFAARRSIRHRIYYLAARAINNPQALMQIQEILCNMYQNAVEQEYFRISKYIIDLSRDIAVYALKNNQVEAAKPPIDILANVGAKMPEKDHFRELRPILSRLILFGKVAVDNGQADLLNEVLWGIPFGVGYPAIDTKNFILLSDVISSLKELGSACGGKGQILSAQRAVKSLANLFAYESVKATNLRIPLDGKGLAIEITDALTAIAKETGRKSVEDAIKLEIDERSRHTNMITPLAKLSAQNKIFDSYSEQIDKNNQYIKAFEKLYEFPMMS